MANATDTTAAKKADDTAKPAEAEPKQRPVKRPAKPAYHVPRGIAWLEGKTTIRVKAGADLESGIIPAALIPDYLERGDIVELAND
jgi:hypothetical protein